MKLFLKWLIRLTKPLLWRLAEAYDLKVQRPAFPYGRHQIEIAEWEESVCHRIPKSVYFNTASGKISVGKNVVFGEDVKLLTGMHMNIADSKKQGLGLHHVPESGRDIVIEDGVYIGSGAILIGPVTIGAFSVVAAGAVVTRNVEPMTMVGGVPARVLRNFG
jgi:acetyltransferase-like isoleucine patch superfamily enzyme